MTPRLKPEDPTCPSWRMLIHLAMQPHSKAHAITALGRHLETTNHKLVHTAEVR